MALDIERARLPGHIGIIPDGNRRWAVRRGMGKGDGYSYGIDPAFELYETCRSLGIKEVSFYGFTQENTRRPREQRESFQAACVRGVERLKGLDADLLVVGDHRSAMFPEELRGLITRERMGGGGLRVNLLINYSWRWDLEMLRATGKLGSQDVSPIDLVIRWGGRSRLSGFLPVQCAYADIFVVESLWPDYRQADLEAALGWYQEQDVTKGG